jgi:hypothetical protein
MTIALKKNKMGSPIWWKLSACNTGNFLIWLFILWSVLIYLQPYSKAAKNQPFTFGPSIMAIACGYVFTIPLRRVKNRINGVS